MRNKGTLSSWNEEKGYGFIQPLGGGKQLFVHITGFAKRRKRPELNQRVSYRIASDQQGRACAADVTLAGERLLKSARSRTGGRFSMLSTSVGLILLAMAAVMLKALPLMLVGYLLVSLITFLTYAADKSAAQKDRWRTSESSLHLLSLLGGWPGAFFAQQLLRHKSKKQPFRFVYWLTVAINLIAVVWLLAFDGLARIEPLAVLFG